MTSGFPYATATQVLGHAQAREERAAPSAATVRPATVAR
jgi:hypothetical protein